MKNIQTFKDFVNESLNESKADEYKNPDILAKEIAAKNQYLKRMSGKALNDEIMSLAKDMMQMARMKPIVISNLLDQNEDFVPELLSSVHDYLKEN